MGKSYLLDTNILIYYFQDSLPQTDLDFDAIFRESFYISIISKIEFLGWQQFTEEQAEIARDAISSARILHLIESVADLAIQLRRTSKIRIADSIIAATAIAHDMKLLTRNTKDFQSARDLEIYNPFVES